MSASVPDLPEPPWWTPRKTAVRRSLSREVIVDAALKVLRAEGIDALSMRRVATELDTGAASLYAHVANKDELLELVYDEVIGEIPLPEPDPACWRELVRQIWIDSHAALARNRDIARVALGRIPLGPNAMRVAERVMTIMREGGVPDQDVAWAIDVIGLYVTANAVEGAVHTANQKAGRDPAEYFDDVSRFYAALPADRFPTTTALVPALLSGDGDQRFAFGLDLLIEGLAARTARGPREAGP